MTQTTFVPQLNKHYHLHVEGMEHCFNGQVIAVTKDWFIIRDEEADHEQALPKELVTSSQEITPVSAEEKAARKNALADKLAALKVLFPNVPEEVVSALMTMVERKGFNMAEVQMEIFGSRTRQTAH